jgi:hypothetical protein
MADPIREYTGEQIILASNQLLFNARKDNIELLAGKTIHLAANNTIQIDVGLSDSTKNENKFLVNAPQIQLGLEIKGRTLEPIVKGDKLEEVLNELMDIITMYSDMVSASVPPYSPLLKVAATQLQTSLSNLRTDIAEPGNIKSDVSSTI